MFNQNNSTLVDSRSSIPGSGSPSRWRYPGATTCKCTHTLGALCNHLEEASACFATSRSDALRRRNLSPEGEHKLPSPCSVTWNSGSGGPSSDAYQWNIHFLPEDFMEVIGALFADGRLNAMRPQNPESVASGVPGASGAPGAPGEVYLAGDFTVQVHSYEPASEGRYELGYTPATMSSIRMFALVEQEDLGNIRAELARYGVQLPEEDGGNEKV